MGQGCVRPDVRHVCEEARARAYAVFLDRVRRARAVYLCKNLKSEVAIRHYLDRTSFAEAARVAAEAEYVAGMGAVRPTSIVGSTLRRDPTGALDMAYGIFVGKTSVATLRALDAEAKLDDTAVSMFASSMLEAIYVGQIGDIRKEFDCFAKRYTKKTRRSVNVPLDLQVRLPWSTFGLTPPPSDRHSRPI
jgi:hypothetical protein